MEHHLKTLRRFFEPLKDGRKTFEIRKDDLAFTDGDILILEEWQPHRDAFGAGTYTGRVIQVLVTYCLREKPFVPDGYVCMGIQQEPGGGGA